MSRFLAASLAVFALFLAGCSTPYYAAMEKFGYAKRDLLVERVIDTRKAQAEAKDQFASALTKFMEISKFEGGALQQKYEELDREYKRSEDRAKSVRSRIDDVENVAEALFREWRQELSQYSNPSLRAESQRQLDATRVRYDELMVIMRRAAARMDPVLATFRDQVLFLKHNLNARALASLENTNRALQADIERLIADMNVSIREAEVFIRNLQAEQR
jgi:hypothetical protein